MVAFYKHYIADWMDGTEGLSDGAYRLYHVVCQLIYLTEGPIALNEHGIAGRCRQSVRAFRKNLQELIDAGKVTVENGRILNSRAGKELGKLKRKPENPKPELENPKPELENPGEIENPVANPLENNDPPKNPPSESSLEKTREDKTRQQQQDAFARMEAAVHAALPPDATWKLKRSFDYSPILAAMQDGADLERDVVPVIRDVSAKAFAEGKQIGSWAYFAEAIRDRMRSATAALAALPRTDTDWPAMCRLFKQTGVWPVRLGPEPGYHGCRCPAEVLAEFGLPAAPASPHAA